MEIIFVIKLSFSIKINIRFRKNFIFNKKYLRNAKIILSRTYSISHCSKLVNSSCKFVFHGCYDVTTELR